MTFPEYLGEWVETHTQYLQALSIKKVHEAIILIRQSGSDRGLGHKKRNEIPWLAAVSFIRGKLEERVHSLLTIRLDFLGWVTRFCEENILYLLEVTFWQLSKG